MMRLTENPIEPIVKRRTVPLAQAEAFDLFTTRIGEWWPLARVSIAESDATGVRFEGRVGGRVVELVSDGSEHTWAEVLAWDPPHRFAMSWHPTLSPIAASIVDVRFVSVPEGTEVTLEHRGWEEFGADGPEFRDQYDPGWDGVLSGYTTAAGSADS